ncbi:UvrD-helicase domain-containing protein [Umezawaea sp. Da 62-37]|uniref:UvrD-helicase domain-containing protein n=1 Tax=Umezawaea sp. Da 62-37 TaxID=3075927 RepID=UPI0028F6D720|nr:UvrD-helicase domain-containing protein [Umezawaea sp. Da 62-37]WNV90374.1 UvrD-helicase domain-containing protein [Umezawaea sp. Da 62-37]
MTSIASPSDARPKNLTDEQAAASGSLERRLFIDAGPGTGKTTVAAQRFGALRFVPESRTDHRAIIAVSFTRAATWALKQRVRRIWGPAALTWPHRIVTLDTIMCELLHDLLRAGLLRWPNGHTELTVIDSWNALAQTKWTRETYKVYVDAADVKFAKVHLEGGARVPLTEIGKHLADGVCTHQDVRDALENALKDETMAARARDRLKISAKALIVDEVFDANDLDIAIIELATQAGDVTPLG